VWNRATSGRPGWGVVFASDADPAVRDALAPLLAHRRAQASALNPARYREFVGPRGHRLGETKSAFLTRQGMGPGVVDPDRVPYYLLVVGDPARIPYRFQYQLDVQYAVGRLHFDTPGEYAYYARSVVAAETAPTASAPRRLVLFGARNEDDRATELSATQLVVPLAAALDGTKGWSVSTVVAEDATKARLRTLLGGVDTPSLLLTASHGMGFARGSPRQLADQGALPLPGLAGPAPAPGPVGQELYFSADDVDPGARLAGLVAFHFACNGAGTPEHDDFLSTALGRAASPVADRPFIARLPRRLLAHESGGALAVVGHVERAWSYSFSWMRLGEQIGTFKDMFRRLMAGQPVGHAMDAFNMKYAELSEALLAEREEVELGRRPTRPCSPASGPRRRTRATTSCSAIRLSTSTAFRGRSHRRSAGVRDSAEGLGPRSCPGRSATFQRIARGQVVAAPAELHGRLVPQAGVGPVVVVVRRQWRARPGPPRGRRTNVA
jgi:hypothetical protein